MERGLFHNPGSRSKTTPGAPTTDKQHTTNNLPRFFFLWPILYPCSPFGIPFSRRTLTSHLSPLTVIGVFRPWRRFRRSRRSVLRIASQADTLSKPARI